MSTEARLRSLEDRHGSLERRLGEQEVRPMPDVNEVQRLKREKLRIKDEMERLRVERTH